MKNVTLVCEAKLSLDPSANESASPSGKITARVTTWGAREGADGRRFNYQPEGFADWASEFAKEGKPLPMFLNHNDYGMPMGQWDSVEFDDEGMTANGKLFLNTAGGSDLFNVLKESPNLFGGVSVGAYADEAQYVDAEGMPVDDDDDEAYFQITKGGLREVSVVMYPNNPQAQIQKLEAFDADGNLNPRILERALRDAGLGKRDATTASSVVKRILSQREAVQEPVGEPAGQSDSDAVVNELNEALLMRELGNLLSNRIQGESHVRQNPSPASAGTC